MAQIHNPEPHIGHSKHTIDIPGLHESRTEIHRNHHTIHRGITEPHIINQEGNIYSPYTPRITTEHHNNHKLRRNSYARRTCMEREFYGGGTWPRTEFDEKRTIRGERKTAIKLYEATALR